MDYKKFKHYLDTIDKYSKMNDELNAVYRKYDNETSIFSYGWIIDNQLEILDDYFNTGDVISLWYFNQIGDTVTFNNKDFDITTMDKLYKFVVYVKENKKENNE